MVERLEEERKRVLLKRPVEDQGMQDCLYSLSVILRGGGENDESV